jgi:DNA-binding transcriptional ArsR family regulator
MRATLIRGDFAGLGTGVILTVVRWYDEHRTKLFASCRTMIVMSLHHPSREDLEVATVLHAFSDPQRLRIVKRLAGTDEPCSCGGFGLEVTKSTLTHHFRVLREAGVIAQHPVGTSKFNSLRREDLDARFPGLLDAVLSAAPAPVTSAAP